MQWGLWPVLTDCNDSSFNRRRWAGGLMAAVVKYRSGGAGVLVTHLLLLTAASWAASSNPFIPQPHVVLSAAGWQQDRTPVLPPPAFCFTVERSKTHFYLVFRLFVFCFFQRQGRCDTFATEFDLEAEEYVPLPKGDVHKKKEIVQDVTLHDLDVANARPQVQTWHQTQINPSAHFLHED